MDSATTVMTLAFLNVVRSAAMIATVSCVVACSGASVDPPAQKPPVQPARPAGPFTVGQAVLGPNSWTEFIPGDAPLVLIAPHGGLLLPSTLVDRSCTDCVTTNDTNTQLIARLLADAFARRTGRRPHLVINLLHRRKFDGNRALNEATGGNLATLQQTWEWMQAAIDSGSAIVASRWQRGLVIDLHGHAHTVPRLELGYLLSAAQLRTTDSALTASAAHTTTSVARLLSNPPAGRSASSLLRGAHSLGALMQARGVPAVPSPATPAPLVGEDYFNGGFNTSTHGSRSGGTVDALQIELHFPGIRDTPENARAFAEQLADALIEFLSEAYGWTP